MAKILGTDPSNGLAVLLMTDVAFQLKKSCSTFDCKLIHSAGRQQVIAIGNPFGLSDTMTTGIMIKTGYLLRDPDTGISRSVIQTDVLINLVKLVHDY